jgi:AGZA family xanthine/uracil permease-like MFS transporter
VEFTRESLVKIPSLSPTFLKLDIRGALKAAYIGPIFVFLFFALFDAIGTLVGVGEKAGVIRDGRMPKLGRALTTDAAGSFFGSLLGTSTVTAYIESAAGVAAGGRTGLANLVTGALFLLAIVFTPIARMFGQDYVLNFPQYQPPFNTAFLHPVTAPALIVVGSLMIESVLKIRWNDACESIPAFLTIILMPLTFKISVGLAAGFISYPVLMLIAGRGRQVHWIIYCIGAATLAGYFLLPLVGR